MKTVYVFGAGASRACGSRTPTIKEIFARAQETGGRSEELREEISEQIFQKFGITADALLRGDPDFEKVFTLVVSDREMAEAGGSVEEQSQIATTEIALESLIYELLITVTWDEITGAGGLYDRLVRSLDEGDLLISFNYDLQLDSALERSNLWSPVDGYGVDFFRYQDSKGKQLRPTRARYSKWRLLKLHGSLNWFLMNGLYGHPAGMGWKSEFSPEHKGREVLVDIKSRSQVSPLGILDTDYVDGANHFHLNVNIIPPSLRKELSPRFADLWHQAQKAIGSADRIAVIGYSLPPTDFAVEWLLRTAARLNKNTGLILDVANPNKDVCNRLLSVFEGRVSKSRFFDGFAEYIVNI